MVGRKKISSTKLAILTLGFLILILILGKAFQFIGSLYQPLSPELGGKKYSWDGESSINILFKNKEVSILSFDKEEKKAIILQIPPNTYMDLSKGYGSWRVESIFDLGQNEKPPIGAKLLKESISNLLGLPIDGIVILKNQENSRLDWIFKELGNNPILLVSFLSQIKSDLTPLEVLGLLKEINSLRADKIVFLDLERSEITKSMLLPDSSRVLGIDVVNLDLFIRENMPDSSIVKEQKTIAVYNATSHAGLAMEAARIITNLGADIIIIRSYDKRLEKSLVTARDESATYKRLSQVFSPHCLKESCELEGPLVDSSRADVNVVIGENFYLERHKR